LVGRWNVAEGVVGEDELAEFGVEMGDGGANGGIAKAGRFGGGVGVEERGGDFGAQPGAAGPESVADTFVGVGFAGNAVGSGPVGGSAAGEARHRQIEAAPEKMDSAALTNEFGAELLEDLFSMGQDVPQPRNILCVVRGVLRVLFKGNGVADFDGYGPDSDINADCLEGIHQFAVEVGD